jgi:hypothetical protein
MSQGTTATLLAVCAVLAACDNTSTRDDLTGPRPGGVTQDVAGLRSRGRPVTHSDGSISFAPATAATLRALVNAAPPAPGTTTQCDQGEIVADNDEPIVVYRPGGIVLTGTFDNIEVPADKVCVLEASTVTHNVTAFAGSRLFIYSSDIGGNVAGLSARVVELNSGTTVGGNVDVRNAGDVVYPFASCSAEDTEIQGDLSCTRNNPGSPIFRGVAAGTVGNEPPPARPVTVHGSVTLENNVIQLGSVLLLELTTIGNNANVNKNTGLGNKSVQDNTVANKLDCKKNDPAFVGGPNSAGNAKGQCF